jgi:hypothetical protein
MLRRSRQPGSGTARRGIPRIGPGLRRTGRRWRHRATPRRSTRSHATPVERGRSRCRPRGSAARSLERTLRTRDTEKSPYSRIRTGAVDSPSTGLVALTSPPADGLMTARATMAMTDRAATRKNDGSAHVRRRPGPLARRSFRCGVGRPTAVGGEPSASDGRRVRARLLTLCLPLRR